MSRLEPIRLMMVLVTVVSTGPAMAEGVTAWDWVVRMPSLALGSPGPGWAPWAAPNVFGPAVGQSEPYGLIACHRSPSPSTAGEIWIASTDATILFQLTHTGFNPRHPTWSPDASRIAFRGGIGANIDLWTIDADGSGLTQVTSNSLAEYDPAWSPDGQRIAFGGREGGTTDVYTVNVDGSNLTRLTYGPGTSGSPCWSPDSQRIGYCHYENDGSGLYVMNADGSGQDLLLGGLKDISHPAWSPDGQRIAFSEMGDASREIYVMNAEGSGLTQLTHNPNYDHHPSWSPDAQRITFEGGVYPRHLLTMGADGSDVRQATYGSWREVQPAWSPVVWVPRCLGWLGTTGYALDGVDPDIDRDGATFTFRIRYFNPDGLPPATAYCRIQLHEGGLWQDYQALPMVLESGEPTTGATYVCSAAFPAGLYQHRFAFTDARGDVPGVQADYQPGPQMSVLHWAGVGGFGSDGVDPDLGPSGATFTFKVKYSSPDGMAPATAGCQIQRSDGDEWQDYQLLPMAWESGDSLTGAVYTCSAELHAGCYRYGFVFTDALGTVGGEPASYHTGPTTGAELDWAGVEGYAGDGVDPDVGLPHTTFTFRAKYLHPSGWWPTVAQCQIQREDGGVWQDYQLLPMVLESGDPASGAFYACTAQLPADLYQYRFAFTDSLGEVPGLPAAYQPGPVISSGLGWAGLEGYSSDGVEPDLGTSSTTFTFRVMYLDPRGETPTTTNCQIQRDDGGVWQDYQLVPMTLESGDPASGAVYACTALVAADLYQYRFAFTDSRGDVSGAPAIWRPGPLIHELTWVGAEGYESDGVDPDIGQSDTTFTLRARYFSADGEVPTTATCQVQREEDGIWQDYQLLPMGLESGDPASGAVYACTAQLTPDLYQHRFAFSDSRGEVQGLPAAYRPGPGICELSWAGTTGYESDGVDPDTGDPASATFTFRAKYAGPGGAQPLTSQCVIQEWTGYRWRPLPALPLRYESGKTASGAMYASVPTTLPNAPLRHRFVFRSPERYVALGAPALWHEGPVAVGGPHLGWTGAPGFEDDGVHGDLGAAGSKFQFRVRYWDAAGDAAAVANLRLWRAGDGPRAVQMKPCSGGSYSRGKVFATSVFLYSPGAYKYAFDFADSTGPADGAPATWQIGPTVVGAELDWVGLPDYERCGVSPREGDPNSTLFTFSVKYTHSLAKAPRTARCLIQKMGGSGWEPLNTLRLVRTTGDLETGAVFSASTRLPNETLRYAFYFEDAPTSVVGGEPSRQWQGPLLVGPPRLRWTGQPGFEADGVDPDSAPSGTQFSFRVVYADSAGNPPLTRQLLIRRDGKHYWTQDMVQADASPYRTGRLYKASLILGGPATYEYRFLFRDKTGAAVGGPTAWRAGPMLTAVDRPSGATSVVSLVALPTPLGAQIAFTLGSDANVTATVLNVGGRPIKAIVSDKAFEAGRQTLLWDRTADTGLPAPSGLYLIRLTVHSEAGRQSTAMATVAVR